MSPIHGDAFINSRWWLVPTGEASTASETILNEPPLRFCPTEETDLEPNCKKTSTPYALFESSSFFWRLLAAPYFRRVVDTKSGQNRTFDPGGSRSHLRACPFLGSWRDGLDQLEQSYSVFSVIRWLFGKRPVFDAAPG